MSRFKGRLKNGWLSSGRMGKGGGAVVETAVAITYLLSANFNASDVTFADTNDVETVATGSVQTGALTVVDTSTGTVDIVSNKLEMVGSTSWQTTGALYAAGVTTSLGLLLKCNLNKTGNLGTGPMAGFNTAATIDITDWRFTIRQGPDTTNKLGFLNRATAGNLFFAYNYGVSLDTDYTVAIIVGGFNSSGEAYKTGDTAADFLYGCAFYYNNGGTWELFARDWRQTAATYYPSMTTYSASDANVDNFIVADGDTDLIGTMTPVHLSLFNGTDEDLLTTEYTPDIGNVWTGDADAKIVSNALHPASATSGADSNFTETSSADGFFQMAFLFSSVGINDQWSVYIAPRFVDFNNLVLCKVGGAGENTFKLLTRITGSWVTRGSAVHGMTDQTEHVMTARVEGANMTCWIDGLNELSYGAAPFTTETTKRILMQAQGSPTQTMYIKDFTIWPITGAQYDVLDNYTGVT